MKQKQHGPKPSCVEQRLCPKAFAKKKRTTASALWVGRELLSSITGQGSINKQSPIILAHLISQRFIITGDEDWLLLWWWRTELPWHLVSACLCVFVCSSFSLSVPLLPLFCFIFLALAPFVSYQCSWSAVHWAWILARRGKCSPFAQKRISHGHI